MYKPAETTTQWPAGSFFSSPKVRHLARGTTWHVLAFASCRLATSWLDARPCPVAARALAAENVNVGGGAADAASNARDLEVGDWDTSGGGTGWIAILIVLLNDNTVFGDVGQGDVGIGDVLHLASGTGDSLDADTILGVEDLAVGNIYVLDGIVITATDGTN